MHAANDLEDFYRRFEACEIPEAEWKHDGHLKIATLLVLRHGCEQALERARTGIQKLNASHGVVTTDTRGYHETLTRVWITLVASELSQTSGPDHERVAQVLNALSDKTLILRHYSRDLIMSREARYGWVEPDLEPLPVVPR